MARRGSAIAGNRAVGAQTAPSSGNALPPGQGPSPLAQQLAAGLGVNGGGPGAGRSAPTDGGWGNAYGGYGYTLPRSPQDFTNGAFGPFSPIVPVAVDPPQGTGFPVPRREEYRVGWNLPVGQPGAEGIKLADFGTLRTLADLYSVARACITFLKSQIAALEWDIAPTTQAAKAMRNDKGAMKDFGERQAEAVRFFRRPDPDYFNWQSWLSAVMEEVLVFDALSIVLRPKWARGLGKGVLWSDLDSLNLISGPTIRPLYDLNGATPQPPAPAYQQYLYGVPRVDLMSMIRERDLENGRLNGSELGHYTNSQLLYLPTQPRRWTPYGFPPIERALIPVMTGLSKQGYQLDYFKEGTVPAVYISPGGDLSPNQIRELQDALNAVAGDTAFHHKVIVLPSGSHTEPQRPTPLADTFDEIVMTQVCSAFGVQPMQIGISPRASAMTSPGAQNQMAKQAAGTQDMTTLQPTLLFLTGIMNTIIQDVCGQQDMRFVFDGMQEEEDEETTTNLIVNQVTHALITIDEARDKLGLQPYGLPQSSDPGFLTPTGFMFLDAALNPQPPAPFGAPPPEGGAGQNGQAPSNQPPGGPQKPQQGAQAQKPQNGQQKPAQSSASTPGHAAAQAANDTAQSADNGGMKKAAGSQDEDVPPAAQQPEAAAEPEPEWESLGQEALEAYITAKIAGVVTSSFLGSATLLGAVEQIIALLAKAYVGIMAKASAKAASEITGVAELTEEAVFGLAQQRAETQRGFASIMVNDAMDAAAQGAAEPPGWIGNRAGLYAQSLAGASNQAYGCTVQASEPEHTIVWRLGETEHCSKCLDRDGHEYTFETLPGFPGDGGFGGLCDGGPLCGCRLEYKEGDKVVDTLGNTQRPDAIGYYAQQRRDAVARRAQMQAERDQFVATLPNVMGRDGTSAQMRATSRDQMRRQLASLANQRIRSSGGYGGVSVEPSDIPASLIASLIPQYGPIPADVPITDVMDAVESMFAGKFAAADVTQTSFGSLILGAVGDTVSGWQRGVASEMEACARHLEKGRAAESWEPRKISHSDVAVLAALVRAGTPRADAVKQALEARRFVNNDGQVFEPDTDDDASDLAPDEIDTPQTGGAYGDAAGGGGYVKLPHDADGIYHDRYDLNPAHKAAADPGDPNPVEAEHVYNQMLANYPPKAIGWIKDARWIGPMAVDPDRVDTEDEDSWAASHEPDRIKHFIKNIDKGKPIKPGVCVQEPGQSTVKVIDGHHRFLAAREAGKPYMAYVGFVDQDSGPWDETHSFQFHQGADPKNKSAGTPGLTKRSGMVSIDVPDGLIPKIPGGVDDVQHITLAYLGSAVTDGQLDDVLRTAKHVAAKTQPFTVTAGGVDSFPASGGSDGKIPAYVPVDKTDALAELREPFARYHASEHQGFTPHITLAYLDEGDPLPDPAPQVTIPVDAICVHLGGNLHARVPLGYDGSSPVLVKSAETGELSSVHRPLGTHGLWGDKLAQLPAYIQNIAHALIKDGHDESGAIQLAIGAVKRWAAGEGKVTPEVQAAAAKAVAEWEKLKAEHSKTKSEGDGA